MLERIEELFRNPLGYMICILIVMLIFSLQKFSKKNNMYRGYTVAYSPLLEKTTIYGMLGCFIMMSIFLVMYMFDVRAENGDTLYGHIMLCTILFYIFFPLYLFYGYKRVFFNKTEIITTGFMKKTKIYYWKDITGVINKNNDKIVVTTINDKFIVDNEFINVKKFLKILEEKNINVKNIS